MPSKAKKKQRVCKVIVETITPSPCKVYKSKSPSSERVRIVKEIHSQAITGKFFSPNQVSRSKHKKRDKLIKALPSAPKKNPGGSSFKISKPKVKTYYSGEDDPDTPPKNLPDNSTYVSVHTNLKIIDTVEGFRIEDVLTLLPRKDVMNICSKKTFRLFQNLDNLRRQKGGSNGRGGQREPSSSEIKTMYTTAGPFPNRYGTGIGDSYHNLADSTKDGIRNIIHQMERLANRFLLSFHTVGLKKAKEVIGWPGFKGLEGKETQLFSNISVGKNVYLPLHVDDDAFYSVTFVVSNTKTEMESEILCYFCFPEEGVVISLRHGDVLLFNPLVPHCISSKRVNCDIFCSSIYLKSKLVGGNNNSLDLTEQESSFQRYLDYL